MQHELKYPNHLSFHFDNKSKQRAGLPTKKQLQQQNSYSCKAATAAKHLLQQNSYSSKTLTTTKQLQQQNTSYSSKTPTTTKQLLTDIRFVGSSEVCVRFRLSTYPRPSHWPSGKTSQSHRRHFCLQPEWSGKLRNSQNRSWREKYAAESGKRLWHKSLITFFPLFRSYWTNFEKPFPEKCTKKLQTITDGTPPLK